MTSASLARENDPTGISFQIDNRTFSHDTASINSIKLHYVLAGEGDPVVLIHGYPERWSE
jgi:hypothetical protein